jgi:surface antigen
MKRWLSSGLIFVFAATLSGCAGQGRSGGITKETGGTVLGGIAGGAIGKQLDERDRLLMARTTQTSLEKAPSGRRTAWRNPDTGHSGTVTPEPSYKSSSGDTCRPYTQTIQVGGKSETAKGSACRNPDGTWRIIR